MTVYFFGTRIEDLFLERAELSEQVNKNNLSFFRSAFSVAEVPIQLESAEVPIQLVTGAPEGTTSPPQAVAKGS